MQPEVLPCARHRVAARPSPLRSLPATFNRDKGPGAVNRGRDANAKVDDVVEQAIRQVDDESRRAMLQQATKLAMDALGIMPVPVRYTIRATRKGAACAPRTDEHTLAFQFRPVKRFSTQLTVGR